MKKLKKAFELIKGFVRETKKDHVSAYAAQSAYFILMSFIPFIILLMASVKYTPLTKNIILDAVVGSVPVEFQNFVKMIILEVYTRNMAVVPITIVLTLWTAGKGIQGLTRGLNSVYDVKTSRNFISERIRSAVYTLIFIICIVLSLILLVFGESIQAILEKYLPLVSQVTEIVLKTGSLLSVFVLSFVFVLMYTFLPNRKTRLRSQLPGAIVSAAAWLLYSWLFSIYLEYFGLSNMYGSLTTIIMIMLWMYYCMYILLLGAEINAYLRDKFRFFVDS